MVCLALFDRFQNITMKSFEFNQLVGITHKHLYELT